MYRIYYADGACLDAAPDVVPERGVQAVAQPDPETGWYVLTGHDYYVWLGGQWGGVDVFGLWDYLASPGWKRVLFGRTIDSEEYSRIYRRALDDLGSKSAYRLGERKVE